MSQPRNAMTVDVEDYFQVSAFERYIGRDEWDRRECRVERNVDRILELFERHGVKATFFTIGWIAERYPEMIRRLVDDDPIMVYPMGWIAAAGRHAPILVA